jgi:hypothetical protein
MESDIDAELAIYFLRHLDEYDLTDLNPDSERDSKALGPKGVVSWIHSCQLLLCEAMIYDPIRPYRSWCPDWTVPRSRSQLGGYPSESGYNASHQPVASPRFSEDMKTIILKNSILIDMIDETQIQKNCSGVSVGAFRKWLQMQLGPSHYGR